ncbi:UDP-2,3-diacylglucosamine diphosphatase [Malaciobacter sp. WC5094]
MYHNIQLKESAIFVADSHYNKKNTQFLLFLKKLEKQEIQTKQLFLMGDNFDFISGESKYFIRQNQELIDILNKLSNKIQIVYLEGNHDYNLSKLFPNILVVKREEQPLIINYKEQSVALSHGDNFINWQYDLYCKIIRNTFLLKFLNLIDFNNFISKKIDEALLEKNICHKINDFKTLVKKRVDNYNTNIVIEGHYHQGKTYKLDNKFYVNIPSLCCDNMYTVFSKEEFNGVTL